MDELASIELMYVLDGYGTIVQSAVVVERAVTHSHNIIVLVEVLVQQQYEYTH